MAGIAPATRVLSEELIAERRAETADMEPHRSTPAASSASIVPAS